MARRLAVFLLALAFALAGCEEESVQCECYPCPAPFVAVLVSDATTGGPVAGVAVAGGGAEWTCAEADGKTRCTSMDFSGEVPALLEVTAPGYAPGSTEVVRAAPPLPVVSPRPSCCGPCPVFTADPVVLSPL